MAEKRALKRMKDNEKDLLANQKAITKKQKKAKKTEEWVNEQLDKIVAGEEEEDNVEEQENAEEEEEVDIKDLPVIPLSTRDKRQLEEILSRPSDDQKSAVIYVGHLPYGFFEYQIKSFLTQFGEVKRVYISKSKKSGRSRGFAFVEFEHAEVAEIVADFMNDYILFNKRIICHVIPALKAKTLPWPTQNIVNPRPYAQQRKYAEQYNNKQAETSASLRAKVTKKQKALAKHNIDYTFDAIYEPLIKELEAKEKIEGAKQAVQDEQKAAEEEEKMREERKAQAELERQAKADAEEEKKNKKRKGTNTTPATKKQRQQA